MEGATPVNILIASWPLWLYLALMLVTTRITFRTMLNAEERSDRAKGYPHDPDRVGDFMMALMAGFAWPLTFVVGLIWLLVGRGVKTHGEVEKAQKARIVEQEKELRRLRALAQEFGLPMGDQQP
jgi:hypothetical protein